MAEFDGHLFVSLLLATADQKAEDGANVDDSVFGDPNGLIGILLTSPHAKAKIKVTARAGEFWDGGFFEGALPYAGEKNWVAPRLHYRYDAMRALNARKACEVSLAVEVDGVPMGDKTVPVIVHPRKECVFGTSVSAGFTDKTGVPVYSGFGWLFAAYMDEGHPFVEKLVKEALATGIVRVFDGYRSADPEQVLLQVFAIWEALSRRSSRYRHYIRTNSASKFVYSEPVRSMDEIAAHPSGTSAEAVVLLSSALLRVGLRPSIVIVDEQITLGVDRSDGNRDFVGIDPTFMGAENPPVSRWPNELRNSLPEGLKGSPSLAVFGAALDDGTGDVLTYKTRFEDIDPHYQMVDVRQARKDGIAPFKRASSTARKD